MGDYQDLPLSYGNTSECSILDTRLKEDTYTDKNQIQIILWTLQKDRAKR